VNSEDADDIQLVLIGDGSVEAPVGHVEKWKGVGASKALN
jgi:hypothetical protein